MPPVTGAAFAMRDGNDEDAIGFFSVEHGVRKDPRSTDMHILFKNTPTVRRGDDFGDGGADFLNEPLAELTSTLFVELDSFLEFQERFRMERVPHFASRRSIRR